MELPMVIITAKLNDVDPQASRDATCDLPIWRHYRSDRLSRKNAPRLAPKRQHDGDGDEGGGGP
jgi:hypothetical protein